ncbi:hypothetical protein STIAU_7928 [Stigmatella aurantiaca DW4/3-1]|uniref:Uncharacterized protein n=1 Tax=Stigmatella aurantiaca (strain DW4/3-1) TaxID=378806 RepID=Q095G5_STIAD|nr:hypothetical protein STIAU_7928 [Stigmatella aurantiaca DW4/3-1]
MRERASCRSPPPHRAHTCASGCGARPAAARRFPWPAHGPSSRPPRCSSHVPVEKSVPSSERLDQKRNALAPANARRTDTIAGPPALQLVHEAQGDARARGAQRVPHRDGSAVDVGPITWQAQLLLHRQVLRGKGLVHLEEIHVSQATLGALQQPPDRRRGADAHHLGITPGDAPVDQPRDGLQPVLLHEAPGGHHHGAGPVTDAAGRARVHHPVLLEELGQLAQPLHGGVRTVVLVAGHHGVPLLALQGHRGNLLLEPARLLRRGEALLREDGILVHRVLGELVVHRELLGRQRHGHAGVAVREGAPEHVLQAPLAQRQPPARAPDDVGRLAHGLGPSGQHAGGLLGEHHLRGGDEGLEARATQPVDAQRRHRHRHARAQPHVARQVDGVRARLHDVAVDDVLDPLGRDAGLGEGRLRGLHPQIRGAQLLEASPIGAKRGALAGQEIDLFGLGGVLHGQVLRGRGPAGPYLLTTGAACTHDVNSFQPPWGLPPRKALARMATAATVHSTPARFCRRISFCPSPRYHDRPVSTRPSQVNSPAGCSPSSRLRWARRSRSGGASSSPPDR